MRGIDYNVISILTADDRMPTTNISGTSQYSKYHKMKEICLAYHQHFYSVLYCFGQHCSSCLNYHLF